MSDLCTWQYYRHSYCVVMHDEKLEPYQAYFSPGTEDTTAPKLNIKTEPFTDSQQMYLEDDDSVQIMAQKVSAKTLYRPEYLYFWIDGAGGAAGEAVNMQFDLIYNVDANTSRKFQYTAVPSREFTEKIGSAAEWQEGQRVVTQNFGNSFLSSFDYPESRIIHCLSLDKFIAYLGAKEPGSIAFNVKTYYPEVRIGAAIIAQLVEGGSATLVKYNAGDVVFQKQVLTLQARNNSIRAIQSPALERALRESTDTKFYDCNILEAVVHINYGEHNENFVDLEKVFHMFPVSTEVPFSV